MFYYLPPTVKSYGRGSLWMGVWPNGPGQLVSESFSKYKEKKKPLVIKNIADSRKQVTDEQIEGNQPQHINNGLNLPNIRFLEFSSLQETYQRQRDTKRQKMKE